MLRILGTLLVVLTIHIVAAADEPRPLPKGLPAGPPPVPPRFATVAALDKKAGVITLHETAVRQIPETTNVEREQDGKKATVSETRYKSVPSVTQRKINLSTAKVFDGAGAAVKPIEMWRSLEEGKVVLLSGDAKKVSAGFRKLLKKEVLIFVEPTADAAPPSPVSQPEPKPVPPGKSQ